MSEPDEAPPRNGPLEGLRVFDLTAAMVGPWASRYLGALGADVLHVEKRGLSATEIGTQPPPFIHGMSVGYIVWNLNKRGIGLDLKNEDDRVVALEILRTCDVLLVNMRPGVAERLGLGFEEVQRVNPRLVYCSVTGWGETGPMRLSRGDDIAVQAFSGFTSVNGSSDDRCGQYYRHFTQLDGFSGLTAAQAILFALVERESTGHGRYVEVSMLEAAASLQRLNIAAQSLLEEPLRPLGSASRWTCPDEVFLCGDGKYLGLSVTSEEEWQGLCSAVNVSGLVDDSRFAQMRSRVENRDALRDILGARLERGPRAYWMLEFERRRVPFGYPMEFDELRFHEQIQTMEYMVEVDSGAWGKVWTGASPWTFSEYTTRWTKPPPVDDYADARNGTAVEGPRPPGTSGKHSGPGEGPLAGLEVIDASEGIAGPFCALALREAGADVIKVESPSGDRTRCWAPALPDGRALVYEVLNAGKRGLVVDFRSDRERDAVRRLLSHAHVLIADASDERDSWSELSSEIGSLIECRFSSFGRRGPWSSRPGSELSAQLYSEATQSLGVPGDAPLRIGTDVASIYAGVFASHAIAALVLGRSWTGVGGRVDVSVLGSAISMRSTMWAALSNPDEWFGLHLDGYTNPSFGGYPCKEGVISFSIGGISDVDWSSVIEEFGLSRYADRQILDLLPEGTGPIARYGNIVYPVWAKALGDLTMEEIEEKLVRVGGRAVRVNSYRDLMGERQASHLDMFSMREAVLTVAPPWHFHAQPRSNTSS
jgi:crotonobetainyl-CoA:carnitine CoA-transferase CaiB-like acyl-CoA transferase